MFRMCELYRRIIFHKQNFIEPSIKREFLCRKYFLNLSVFATQCKRCIRIGFSFRRGRDATCFGIVGARLTI